MATANAVSSSTSAIETAPTSTVEMAAKAVCKRYESLITVRTKAIKGKGAWYWTHLEPLLICTSDSGAPKAVKLRCSLCDALFSASNPSRTASEHLKRGTCPNFSSPSATAGSSGGGGGGDSHEHPQPKPISSLPPSSLSRKRSFNPYQIEILYSSPSTSPILSLPSPLQPNLVLSGGKEDLGALAMLEDSVKKLKSPMASPNPALSKVQVDAAFSFLSDWFYECAGVISFSSIEHPKFRAFLQQVGLPSIPRRDLAGTRLDARYEEAQSDAEARIRDALFFQVAADGWKSNSDGDGSDSLVSITVNLPNGTTVFRRALISDGRVPCKHAEEVLWETVKNISGGGRGGAAVTVCAGIVSDRFKSTALRSLEGQHHWMVNLPCQVQGFRSLIKDFTRGLSLFHNVASKCSKIASFFNNNSSARTIFHKHQTQELDRTSLLRCSNAIDCNFMIEDIIASTRAFHHTAHDESYKLLCLDNPEATQLADLILDMKFWNDVQAANSLVKLITDMIQEMQTERPLVGQCLPLWESLRTKIKAWCTQYGIDETAVHKVFDKRFKRNYHPAWAAAFILDPLYLTKDTSGKYLPPYKCLTPEQDKDVDKLITRLASREEAHIVLNELMKWRSEGMDPIYAQAVQVKQLDPATGKMKIANPQSSRLVWETCLSEEFGTLGKVAVRLIFLHATAGGFKCNASLLRWLKRQGRSKAGMERAQKMIFVAAQARLERRDFSGDEDKDGELFANGDVDELNETFLDAS